MAPTQQEEGKVFSATYSNVPVYESFVEGNHVMRRRSDDWINATHILKVAEFDKPARTRILEREVQKGVHEKVQGGYGKYQGTWIPLADGKALAEKHGVFQKLIAIIDFVPGDRTPPPAPKHTITSSKQRAMRPAAAPKRVSALNHIPEDFEQQFHDSETPDNVTLASDAYADDYADMSQFSNSRKRKRMDDVLTPQDEQHQLWAEELLDYFMLLESPSDPFHRPPTPPPGINLDRPIDDKGHTALHWAAAMGDTAVVRDLIARGASIDCLSKNGETPLMRAVIFTNSFDKQTMEKIAGWLIQTVSFTEWFGSTVFHHIAATTSSKSKYACARYYLDAILNRMSEIFSPLEIEKILNFQDRSGDTAITIAARNGARKCVRGLIGRNAAVDIPNDAGETADELIVQLNHRRRDGRHRQLSSSPFQLDPSISAPLLNGIRHSNSNPLLNSSPSLFPPDSQAPTSEAATFLTTQIFPLLQSKSAKLAGLYDAEIADKDTEVAELERVVRGRREEIDGLKRGVRELIVRCDAADDDSAGEAQLGQRLDGLEREAEDRREAASQRELEGLVHEELARGGGDAAGGDEGGTRDALVQRIGEMQAARRALVKEVVRNQALAGVGERQADYRRLIAGALGVREEEVEGLLVDICAELEEGEGTPALGAAAPMVGGAPEVLV